MVGRLNLRPDRRVALLVLADASRVRRTVTALADNRRAAGWHVASRVPYSQPDSLGVSAGGVGPSDLLITTFAPGRAWLPEEEDLRLALAAREVIMVATGHSVRDALRTMLVDPPDVEQPASLLRSHQRLTVVCDQAAAAVLELPQNWNSDHIIVVLGHREPGISLEHRISGESLDRLHHAERLTRRTPARAVVLTGYTATGGLSEAEQMAVQWVLPGVPKLLEVGGRSTIENAIRSLPLLLALGGIRRVTVVTSAWHVRAPYFFAPYRKHGLKVSYGVTWRSGQWRRMLAHELATAPQAPARRRTAFDAFSD